MNPIIERLKEAEEWRSVKGHSNTYEVSNYGQVKNTKSGKILCGSTNEHGRKNIRLGFGEPRTYYIHRLVATAFLGEPPSVKHEVNHIDGDPKNNRVANLEWVTRSENILHAFSHALKHPQHGSSNGQSKLTESDVKQILGLHNKITLQELAKRFSVTDDAIQYIVYRRGWKHISAYDQSVKK